MAKYSVAIPELFDGELRVGSCSVCTIDNIIGANEDECTLHFSHPGVEYNYGYDYITATDEFIWGYYIGVDRFYEIDGMLGKEYILYELGVFQEDESERVASLLYSHLIRLASDRGCQRIICSPCGGNEEFYALLEKGGFKRDGELLSLRLDGVKMCPQDEVVLPRVGEALRFEDLFFLREAGFSVDQKKCKFENEVGSITVNRLSTASVSILPSFISAQSKETPTLVSFPFPLMHCSSSHAKKASSRGFTFTRRCSYRFSGVSSASRPSS